MPKHHRTGSVSRSQYVSQLPGAVPPSPIFAPQQQLQNIQVPAGYYTIPAGPDSVPFQIAVPQTQPQPYETFAADAPSLPPSQHRPSSGAWSVADDHRLIKARMQGLNWSQIKDAFFPTKSANACRKRHERLMEKKGVDDWDTRKFQLLAKEYMGMRKEIWSALASKTGEKWNVVEAKCMSNGLKNLQSAARAASRRNRIETGSHVTGYDDDSGISGIGLTPVDELDASFSSPEPSSTVGPTQSFSTNSVASGLGYNIQGQSQPHLHPSAAGDQPTFGVAAYVYGGSHNYSSSVSSTASMGRRYGSRGGSPYMESSRR